MQGAVPEGTQGTVRPGARAIVVPSRSGGNTYEAMSAAIVSGDKPAPSYIKHVPKDGGFKYIC